MKPFILLLSNPLLIMIVISSAVFICLVYVFVRKFIAHKKLLKKRSNN